MEALGGSDVAHTENLTALTLAHHSRRRVRGHKGRRARRLEARARSRRVVHPDSQDLRRWPVARRLYGDPDLPVRSALLHCSGPHDSRLWSLCAPSKYGAPLDTSLPAAKNESFRPTISGGIILCPMLAISPDSRPSYAVELFARLIASVAGPFPLAAANKGKNSEDPDVEEAFNRDPQTYHGKLRIATGLAILAGLTSINDKLSHLRVPFLLCHGTGDRVTSYHGSEKLYREAESSDKEIKLYEGVRAIRLALSRSPVSPPRGLFTRCA